MFLILLLYSLFTVIITYPLIFNMSSTLFTSPEGPADGIGIIWNFWWHKFSYINDIPSSPITYMNAPYGIDLSQGMINPFWHIYGKWMSLLTNEIFAYNFSILLSFILAGIGMYCLAYFLLKDKWISFFCGFAYAFCPYHMAHAFERNGLASIQWIPFAILYLFKASETYHLKDIVLYSFFITLNFYFEPHYGFFSLIFSSVYLIYQFIISTARVAPSGGFPTSRMRKWGRRGDRTRADGSIKLLIRSSLISLFFIFLFMSPIYLKTLKNFLSATETQKKVETLALERSLKDAKNQSAKLLNYILPSVYHPIFGTITKSFLDTHFYGPEGLVSEHTLFLGFTILFFLILVIKIRKYIDHPYLNFLWVGLIASYLFSLSPFFNLGFIKIPFPSLLLHSAMPSIRAFSRFGIFVMLCTILITGIGMKNIFALKSRLYIVLMCIILAFEFFPIPPLKSKVLDIPLPPEYAWIKNQKRDFIIAEYPLNHFNPLYQMKYQKRTLNSFMLNSEILEIQRRLRDLTDKNTVPELAKIGIKYILIDIEKYKKEVGYKNLLGTLPDFKKIPGLKLAYESKDKRIYLVKN